MHRARLPGSHILDPTCSAPTTLRPNARACSVRALSEWKYGADGGMTAPVIGQTASAVTFSASPTPLRAMSDLGKPEQARGSLAVTRSRSTSARLRARRCSSCARSRSMRTSTAPTWLPHPGESTSRVPRCHAGIWSWDRVVEAHPSRAGVEFYEYTLALPARKCNAELATACLPERVELISAAVGGGTIHVLEVSATAAQWAQAGEALKRLRSSFALVGDSESSPPSESP